MAVLAHVVRGELVESIHRGHLALVSSDAVELAVGDIDLPVYPRSAVKPLQAAAMVAAGLNLPERLLALASASHSGAAVHRDGAVEILATAGLNDSSLQCPVDLPYGSAERVEWGSKPKARLAHNCSGKHSAMLATCAINGWPLENYRDPHHPLQQQIAALIEQLAGEKIAATTVDGCGAPLFAISTRGLAKAISALVCATTGPLAQVAHAMCAFPEMVAGEGRTTTQFMRAVPGLLVKEGAEGVQIFGLPDGRACAMKIEDGSMRALPTITGSVLKRWGVANSQTDAIAAVPVLGAGEPVGEIISLVE